VAQHTITRQGHIPWEGSKNGRCRAMGGREPIAWGAWLLAARDKGAGTHSVQATVWPVASWPAKNRMHLVLFGMQNRTFGPYLAATHSVQPMVWPVVSWPAKKNIPMCGRMRSSETRRPVEGSMMRNRWAPASDATAKQGLRQHRGARL
jgi:hypothetical protein